MPGIRNILNQEGKNLVTNAISDGNRYFSPEWD